MPHTYIFSEEEYHLNEEQEEELQERISEIEPSVFNLRSEVVESEIKKVKDPSDTTYGRELLERVRATMRRCCR